MVARYADDNEAESIGIHLDPRLAQNLGVRLAAVERAGIAQSLDVPGTFVFNERLAATVQTRTGGFVSRTHARAAGDVVARDAPLVDLLVPDWAAAETEYLALLRSGDSALAAAARQRLVLLGLPEAVVAKVEQTRQVYPEFTVVAPIAGVIDALEVRAGMTVSAGATVARIQGLDPIWIDAAVPEAQGALATLGKSAAILCAAYPGVTFKGRIVDVLPQTNVDTHTLRVRIEVANPVGRLKPGMFARVQWGAGDRQQALLVPTEAVIHTGTRDLVIVASDANRFEPVEVRVGGEYGARTSIVAGLEAGQKVVVSGQFLIDSEASLRGIAARMNPASDGSRAPGTGSAKP
jgi:Cu(I)/Ag(I) efflux system membrane fusion protein